MTLARICSARESHQPKILLQSKWAAVNSRRKEKHFFVTAVRCD